jgi:hypothetical protein
MYTKMTAATATSKAPIDTYDVEPAAPDAP